jgi:GPH family glycoside/pentoside/hexuronide:cation symporter
VTQNKTSVLGKLSLKIKVLYGVAEFGISMMTSSLQFFLLFFYTDVLGYSPALVGTALLVGKLSWDAFNDPLFGYLSDRTKSRFGRRRPYMIFGAIPFGFSVWLLFSVPAGLTGAVAFFTVLGSFLLFDTFHTVVSVPYFAMTPELTSDYDERTSLTAVRKIYGVSGYIAGAVATTLIASLLREKFGLTQEASYSSMGALFGIVATVTILISALTVKENPEMASQQSKIPPVKALLQTLKNKPFIRLVMAFLISSFSFTLMTGLFPYYMNYQLDMRDKLPIVLLIMMGSLALFLFFWKWVADKINKGPSYALGLFIACCAMTSLFFLPFGPSIWIYPIAFVVGFGFSSQYVFPWSMLPDVIEHDQKVTGERREGIYYGIWAFLVKITAAFGVAAIGWSLDYFGYIPNQVQTESARFGIRLFFGPLPAVIIVMSLPLLIWFPITRSSHNQLIAELQEDKI